VGRGQGEDHTTNCLILQLVRSAQFNSLHLFSENSQLLSLRIWPLPPKINHVTTPLHSITLPMPSLFLPTYQGKQFQ